MKNNHTYGVTTMLPEHVTVHSDGTVTFDFIGKKQQQNLCHVDDPQIVWWVKYLLKKKGGSLLSTSDYKVSPESVNRFLQDFHPNITAKVWRTWFANAYFINQLIKTQKVPETEAERRALVKSVVAEIAEQMHHTPEINRQSYLIKDLPQMYIQSPVTWKKMVKATDGSTDFLLAFLNYHTKETQ